MGGGGGSGGNTSSGPPEDEEAAVTLSSPAMARFYKEAQLMAAMRHPNVISLLGFCVKPPALVTGEGRGSEARLGIAKAAPGWAAGCLGGAPAGRWRCAPLALPAHRATIDNLL